VLLHSGRDDDGRGRWSFVAADPDATIAVSGGQVIERDAAGKIVRASNDEPWSALERFAAERGVDVRDRRTVGDPEPRVIGWIEYEGAFSMAAYSAVARWRGADARPELIGAPAAVDRLAQALSAPTVGPALAPGTTPGAPPRFGPLTCPDDPDGMLHRARVRRVLDYLLAGDAYQVNLARRLSAPVLETGDPLALYAALDAAAPAPYAGLIEGETATVVSGSPECFLSRTGGDARIATRPIKGTRPRIGEPVADAEAAAALSDDPKDTAEHLMIVDLERNDLGRVAVTGSVRVDRLGYVVELPHLYHRVSTVSAELRPEVGLATLLEATFPGGSITGAPKIRAMEIIAELEPVPRGPYCGALGYLGAGGAIELAIAIRIAVLSREALHLHVGGGIVADSDPDRELEETEDKAAGWRRALNALAG
jgi:anthranilate/para-aminobenzoate synthase component I